MEYSIRHFIPGRIRLHVPSFCAPSPLAESILSWLQMQDYVTSARINYDCSSLVIDYDKAQETLLGEQMALMDCFGLDTLDQLLRDIDPTGVATAVGTARSVHGQPKQRWPLALPTVSLALAFSANPLALAVNVPLMLFNAYPIFNRAWTVWCREGRLNVDFLDTIAITASIFQGKMITGGVITWLIRLGDWIRDLTAAGSKRAVSQLLEFRAKVAWIVKDGTVVAISASSVVVGDMVVVYPGEMIPVDGEVVRGNGMIDQKTITGEGLPVSRSVGQAVFAATILREGQLTLRAIRVGNETTAGQIARLIDSAPVGDTRMQNHAERFADRLVLPTLGFAIGTAVISRNFNRFLSLIIVDYGTGIRVAAPTAVLSSMTYAARLGIIIKSGAPMEKLAQVDTVVFDKTGTLSHGTPHVVDILSFNQHLTTNQLLALTVAAETHLRHPVAEALREKIHELGVQIPACDETEYKIGLGVEGMVDGYYIHAGSERFLRQSGIGIDHVARERSAIDRRGCSSLYLALDGKLAGIIAYEDRIRPESYPVIERLHSMGIRDTIMLTGDNSVVAASVGKRLGLTRQIANMMPADKAGIVQDLQRDGRIVAMVGDGINDAPALSYADVGIAMKYGADITHESADVVLMEDSLWKLIKAIEISRSAVSLIKQNYGIVAAMNTLALGLALPGGLVSPEAIALISNGSAIVASLNGIRPTLWRR